MTAVGIVAYNRPSHLRAVLNALCENSIRLDQLFIFCDGPKTPSDEPLCMHVRGIAREVDWTDCVVTEHTRHRGLKLSVIEAVDHMLFHLAHNNVILLEDDCVPGPYFLSYMKACLDKYQNHPNVLGISGYTVPIPEDVQREYPWSVYFTRRIGSWGWATWRDRWQLLERDLNKAIKEIGMPAISSVGRDMVGYTVRALKGLDVWTPNWQMTALRQNASYVYPVVSHVTNIGFDGSGTCKVTSDRYKTPIAKEWPTAKILAPAAIWTPAITEVFRRYYPL